MAYLELQDLRKQFGTYTALDNISISLDEGEFLSLLGAFVWDRPYAIVATFGVILAAVYALWAFQRAFTGKPSGENVGTPAFPWEKLKRELTFRFRSRIQTSSFPVRGSTTSKARRRPS